MTPITTTTARTIAALALVLGVAFPIVIAVAFDDRADDLDERADQLRDRIDDLDIDGTAGGRGHRADLEARLEVIESGLDDIAARLDTLADALARVEAEAEAADVIAQAAGPAVTAPPTTRPPAPAAHAASAPEVAPDDPFAALAACESTGDRDGQAPHRIDPAAVNPTGKYRGAFQFDLPTWQSVGGTGDPAAHPYAEQLARAQELQRRRGWAPWPACSEALGLR